jgi:hypothetical protein
MSQSTILMASKLLYIAAGILHLIVADYSEGVVNRTIVGRGLRLIR